jgi:uncharacterized damage-inducible protein DinB
MIARALIQELQQEAQTTRRVLERVPAERLSWRPHAKSMSLGQLALHIAALPGNVAQLATQSEIAVPDFEHVEARSVDEILAALDDSIGSAREILEGFDDAAMGEIWRVKDGDREVMAVPRGGMLRAILLNHWYHHRGQLTVYLRLLDVPLPSVYGPSADEQPFAS